MLLYSYILYVSSLNGTSNSESLVKTPALQGSLTVPACCSVMPVPQDWKDDYEPPAIHLQVAESEHLLS